ncbi:MAG: hypothetical protein WAN40_07035 [Thermoplasmata archaeon]
MPALAGSSTAPPAVDGTAVVGPWTETLRPKRRSLGGALLGASVGLFVLGIVLSIYSQPECIGTPGNCVYIPYDPYSVYAAVVVILAVLALGLGLAFFFWISSVAAGGSPQPAWLTLRCNNCGKLFDPSLARCDRCGAPSD